MPHILKNTFNSGVMSPNLDARLDVEKVSKGLRDCENFVISKQGGIFKRAGFVYKSNTKNNQVTRLAPFNYNVDTKFQFAFAAGALRILEDGIPVILPVSSASAWSGTTSTYLAGASVVEGNVFYASKVEHTPSVGNQPPSTSWNTLDLLKWAASTAYAVGDFVWNNYEFFVCTTAHTSTGSFDSTKFKTFGATGGGSNTKFWVTSTAYAVGDYRVNVVASNLRWFRCKTAHTSGATTQPGVGASWSTYWTEYTTIPNHNTASFAYLAGDVVKVGTDLYFATSNHTSSTSNEPLDASSPWSKVLGTKAWDGTSTARALGDTVFCAGAFYVCQVAHTSSTYISTDFTDLNYLAPVWTATPAYQTNIVVYNGTNKAMYLCVQEHDTASTTEPGTTGGQPYWQKLRNLFYWTSGDNYVAGQYVFGGVNQVCRVVSDHTAGTFATDLSDGKLIEEGYKLELETDYLESELFEVSHMQINDVVWLMHPLHETKLLTRFGDTAWRLASISWENPPMRDENADAESTITPSGTTGDITLTASRAIFDAGHIGSYFTVAHRREQASVKLVLSATGESSAVRVQGRWDVYIYGTTWVGEVALLYSYDGTNYVPLRNWVQPVANMRTVTASGTFNKEVYLKLKMTVRTAGGASDYAWLEAADARVSGLVKITGVSSPTLASGTVVSGKSLFSTDATMLWSEAAYSDYRGWPRCGTLHEGRIVLAGASAEPQTLRFSKSDDFYNFLVDSLDTSALTYLVASQESNSILWLASIKKSILIGTTGDEFVLTRSTESKFLSPTNPPDISPLGTKAGSANIPAVSLGSAILHIRSDRYSVRELSYDFQDNNYTSVDLCELAEHITESGIKQIAVVRQPEDVLYCVTNDGRLLTLTYNRKQNVVAWSEHTTDGDFESIAVTYGGDTSADEVWVVVKRTINSQEVRFIEQLHNETSKMRFEGTANEMCYLDAAVLKTGASSTSVTGLSHLNGKAVYALADGIVRGPFTVSGGAITLSVAASTVWVGIPYTAFARGTRIEIPMQDGTAQGREAKVTEASMMTRQSNGFELISDNTDDSLQWANGISASVSDISARVTDPKWTKISLEGRTTKNINWSVRSSKPLPVNILAVEMSLNVTGK